MLERQKVILQLLPVGAGLTDPKGALLDVNPAICRLLGFRRKELVGSSIFELTTPTTSRRCEVAWEKMTRGERKGYRIRARHLRKSGDYLDGELFVKPIYGPQSRLDSAVIVLVDRGPQFRAERAEREAEAARLLASALLRGQEAERRRLARDLHDDFSQRLAVMAMRVSSISAAATIRSAQQSECDTVLREIAEMNEALRLTAHQLHPATLERLGLPAALAAHCEDLDVASGDDLQVAFTAPVLQNNVHPDVALCLYRVAQECLHNAVKYAHANKLHVRLRQSPDGQIGLSVSDDGVGFDVHKTNLHSSLGMVSMRERLRLVGGTLSVTSRLGRGTRITASVPPRHSLPAATSSIAPNRTK